MKTVAWFGEMKAKSRLRMRPSSGPLSGLGILAGLIFLAALWPSVATAAECTNTWVGPAEGTWKTVANWSAGHVPNSTDVACIGAGKTAKVSEAGQAAVVQGEGNLFVQSTLELLSVTETSSINVLTLSSGTLTGAATLKVASTLSLEGESTMSGTGSTIILPGATGSKTTTSYLRLKKRHFINEGTFSTNAGTVMEYEGAEVQNTGTFSVNTAAARAFEQVSASTVVNTGTFQRTVSGTTEVLVPFENRGTVSDEVGVLAFGSGGSSSSSNKWVASEGTEIRFIGGTYSLSGGSFEGAISVRSSATVNTEGVSASSAKLETSSSGTLNITSGTMTAKTLTMNGGTVSGAGILDIASTLFWEGDSTMSGTGSTVILSGATLEMNSAVYTRIKKRHLINEGTFSMAAGSLVEYEGAEVLNAGTFNVNTSRSRAIEEVSASTIVNTGTFRRTVSGLTEIVVPIENKGLVKSQAGTLSFIRGGSATSAGEWVASEGTEIKLATGTFTLSGGTLAGSIGMTSSVNAQGVNAASANLTVSGGSLSVSSGTVTTRNLTLTGSGEISGAGNLAIANSFTWNETWMTGTGSTVILPGATGSKSASGYSRLKKRHFINEGTFSIPGGTLVEYEGAEVLNAGTMNVNTASAHAIEEVSKSSVVNTGVLQKTEGAGTAEVLPPFENYGTIRETSGHLKIVQPVAVSASNKTSHHSKCGDPVDCASGNFSEAQTDFEIGGRGVGLDLTRTYNAQAAATAGSPGIFGYGWSNSFGDHLTSEESGKKITLTQADGGTVPFTQSGSAWTAPVWSQDTLTGSSETGYTLTLPEQTKYKFSGSGRLESVADRNGNETALSYNGSGKLETITDPAGRKITLTYNGEGLVESAKDPMGHVVKYTYESKNLKTVTLPGEASPRWQFKYDGSHRMTSMTDGRGGKTTNEYDGSSRVISQTDPAGHTLTFKYEPFHTTITNKATGAVTDERFTSNNQPYSITHGYGTANATTETFTYNVAGQLLSKTDGDGHKTTYGYNAAGDRTSERNAAEDETKWTYDETHDVLTETTPNGETTTITRDSHGNPETISRPAPGKTTQTTSYAYDSHGQLESMTNPLEQIWQYEYDSQGDRIAEVDPEGDKRTWEYNEDSQLTSIVSPRGNAEGAKPAEFTTAIERDAQGRPIKVTDPLGDTTKFAYDGNGNLESETDPNGHKTKFTYNADDERTKVEKPNGDIEETGYDGAGQVTSQTDGNKHTTTYVRNVLEQPIEIIDPLGRKTIEEYDAAGNLKKLIDPAKRETSYSYDPANRLTGIGYSEEGNPSVKYEYDPDGNLIHMSDGTGETSYTYDQLDRLTQSVDGHGDAVGYEYDLGNEQTTITYPNGKSVLRAFDNDGRLESVTDWLGGTTTFAYDPDSDLERVTFPISTGNVDAYSYSAADRMTEAKFNKGKETLAALSYAREKAGQIETAVSKGLPGPEEISYAYDENGRLTKAGSASYEYDAADNLTKAPGTTNSYDKAGQLEAGTGVSYSYDEMGERTKSTPTGGPATTYAYNQAGDLTSVKRPEEGEVSEIDDSYAYNGTGVRMSQTISGVTSYMTWDTTGSLPLILNDGRNSYIYGPGNTPIEQISSEEAPAYYHHDQLGSTRMLTSSSSEATGTFSYGSYGALEGSTGSQTTPLGYAGQYSDGSGLQYLRARYYDPATGQFMTRDPMTPITHAPYGYVQGNPLSKVDPSGYCGVESVESFLESINPISTENCAYQGAESLKGATGIDLPGTLSQPAVVDAGAVGICLIPGADLACGAGLIAAFGAGTAGVVAEGVENQFCDLQHLLAEESVNALLLGFGGLGLTTLNMAGDAPLFARAILRGGPAAAQGLFDLAHGQ